MPLSWLYPLLPEKVSTSLRRLPPHSQVALEEIRLRSSRPVSIRSHAREQFLSLTGTVTNMETTAISLSQREIQDCFQRICEYSVYRYARELSQGFITIAGGHRVGVAGTRVCGAEKLAQLRDISSLNFRIAHEVKGCAEALYRLCCVPKLSGLLLVGGVGTGKTTMLRDLCRILGSRHTLSLIDERGEIAAMHQGTPGFSIGAHTDVLDGFPRAEGLVTALRVLTPEILVCDEIGTAADAAAIMQIWGCGVPVIASAHAGTLEELKCRSVLRELLQAGVFSHLVVLSAEKQGEIADVIAPPMKS